MIEQDYVFKNTTSSSTQVVQTINYLVHLPSSNNCFIQIARETEQENSGYTYAWIKTHTETNCTFFYRQNNYGNVYIHVQN